MLGYTQEEFARLTVGEYRQAIADLVGGFPAGRTGKSARGETGLRGEYFTTGGGKLSELGTQVFCPVDHLLNEVPRLLGGDVRLGFGEEELFGDFWEQPLGVLRRTGEGNLAGWAADAGRDDQGSAGALDHHR